MQNGLILKNDAWPYCCRSTKCISVSSRSRTRVYFEDDSDGGKNGGLTLGNAPKFNY
jgi:hypothetical protein